MARTQIAFYAPLKSPRHPVPSGDRKIAQLFFSALQSASLEVKLASQLRSFDKTGDANRQRRLINIGRREATRILKRWQRQSFKPKAWFSYHLYYKAPDLIGPIICQQLNIPYIIAEASWAVKRANGPWSIYHQQLDIALQRADKVICINPVDEIAIRDYYSTRATSPVTAMKLFIDNIDARNSLPSRAQVALSHFVNRQPNPELPWLISIAMMRSGDKFKSYQQLAKVIHKLEHPHQLLIVGDGEMRQQIADLFADLETVFFTGALNSDQINSLLTVSDILVWPAINEALGMVFLEAQRASVAVIAGDQGGVSSIVKHGESGLLSDAYDTDTMAQNIDQLVSSQSLLAQFKTSAQRYLEQHHSIASSAKQLATTVQQTLQSK